MQSNKTILFAKLLTYSGTLPLLVSLLGLLLHLHTVNYTLIAITYGAIILSFLSGIHWAIHIFFSERCPFNLLLTSNIIALIAWVCLLLEQGSSALLLQALCFLCVWLIDYSLYTTSVLPEWFYLLRRNATVMVVLTLLLLAYFV